MMQDVASIVSKYTAHAITNYAGTDYYSSWLQLPPSSCVLLLFAEGLGSEICWTVSLVLFSASVFNSRVCRSQQTHSTDFGHRIQRIIGADAAENGPSIKGIRWNPHCTKPAVPQQRT